MANPDLLAPQRPPPALAPTDPNPFELLPPPD
jgi:hypothetical protein